MQNNGKTQHQKLDDLLGIVTKIRVELGIFGERLDNTRDDLKDAKIDYEKRFRLLEGGERKTIVIASLVAAVVTGGGALLLHLIG